MLGIAALALGANQVVEEAAQGPMHDHWAVLVAGSAGYGNYRHQADVCHAYQLVKKAGVKPEHIITLAVDDIANNEENPFPGVMYNKPTPEGTPGVDVYDGCAIDYSGKEVTPETFVKVLTGDSTGLKGNNGTAKVLASTDKSRVFVNFVDHGGVNLIGFPESTMHAKELIGALQKMSDTQMYKELVFYLEACESGSMFKTLPDDIHIYATSAANAKESSWGTYCPPDDKVDGKSLNSCLGDLYSVKWMEDSDDSIGDETLAEQFTRVKTQTSKSHVTEFGDTSLKGEETSNFQGKTDTAPSSLLLGKRVVDATAKAPRASTDLPSADAELASAYARFMNTGSPKAAAELTKGMQERMAAKATFEQIATAVTGAKLTARLPEAVDDECHYVAHKAYVAKCGEWTTGSLKHSADLAIMCAHTKGDARPIVAAIGEACAQKA
jgi:legumain